MFHPEHEVVQTVHFLLAGMNRIRQFIFVLG